MDFEPDADGFAELDDRVDGLVSRVTEAVAADARRNCPGPGPLRDSITVAGDEVSIGTSYWDTVEFGSPAHVIRATNKRALAWPGAEHPVRAVHHPGTPEQAPMRRALYRVRGEGL